MQKYLECMLVAICTFIGTSMVHGIINSYPNSPEFNITTSTQNAWSTIVSILSERELFLLIWLLNTLMFWFIACLYTYVDFKKPSLLMPFKIQSDWNPNKDDVIKCVKVYIYIYIHVLLSLNKKNTQKHVYR